MLNVTLAVFGVDLLYICISISGAECSQDKGAMHQNFNVVLIGEHWLYFYPTWSSSSGWDGVGGGGCSQTIWCMDCCSQHINIQSGPHHYQHQHWLTTKYINKQLARTSSQLTFKVRHQLCHLPELYEQARKCALLVVCPVRPVKCQDLHCCGCKTEGRTANNCGLNKHFVSSRPGLPQVRIGQNILKDFQWQSHKDRKVWYV